MSLMTVHLISLRSDVLQHFTVLFVYCSHFRVDSSNCSSYSGICDPKGNF